MTVVDRLGLHRVVAPAGALPQAADVLDPAAPPRDDELVLQVSRLVLDAASARQLANEHGVAGVAAAVAAIVARRGKLQNPVTGSGGIARGRVHSIGNAHPLAGELAVGSDVATLVSLTLVPLRLDEVKTFEPSSHQLEVDGWAILPPAATVCALPGDLDETVALAALDVAGAPSQVAALAPSARSIFVLGAGAAGILSLAAARRASPTARIVIADRADGACDRARGTRLADAVLKLDATDAVPAAELVQEALGGPSDLTVSVCDAPGCEATCYLSTAATGTVLFFSMATSFTAAALGAEGIGSDVRMLIGNGFSPDRGELALDLVRSSRAVGDALQRSPQAGR